MSRQTDHAQLDLWKLNLDVAFGRANGKIIWQPRVLAWFTDRQFAKQPLPAPYTGMTEPELYQSLGCSNRIYDYRDCFIHVDPPQVKREQKEIDAMRTLSTIITPVGSITELARKSDNSWWLHYEKHWIETQEDMKVATWLYDHADWRWDQDMYDRVCEQWGRLGAPTMFMPRVSIQHLYLDMMGVERTIYALHDWKDTIDDFFRALHGYHLRLIDIINASPIMLINYGDNLHCATLSPKLYEKYVLPFYLERSDRLHTAGKFISSHWDGDTKALLRYAKSSGLDAIEAITPKPQGDVTLEEMKDALGDEIYLLDGIPAVLFNSTYSEEELIECTEKVIKLFAPKLILGISDELPAIGDIERIRIVGKMVDDYNAGVG